MNILVLFICYYNFIHILIFILSGFILIFVRFLVILLCAFVIFISFWVFNIAI